MADPTHIKLYGSKANRFEDIKAALEAELGYEPTNPETIGLLVLAYDGGLPA